MIQSWKYIQLDIACVWEQACEHLLGEMEGTKLQSTQFHTAFMLSGMKWGLAPIPSPWDNLGQLIPCTNQRRGKVSLKELGIWSRGTPGLELAHLGREVAAGSLCTTHRDGEDPCSSRTAAGGEGTAGWTKMPRTDPIAEIKALAL